MALKTPMLIQFRCAMRIAVLCTLSACARQESQICGVTEKTLLEAEKKVQADKQVQCVVAHWWRETGIRAYLPRELRGCLGAYFSRLPTEEEAFLLEVTSAIARGDLSAIKAFEKKYDKGMKKIGHTTAQKLLCLEHNEYSLLVKAIDTEDVALVRALLTSFGFDEHYSEAHSVAIPWNGFKQEAANYKYADPINWEELQNMPPCHYLKFCLLCAALAYFPADKLYCRLGPRLSNLSIEELEHNNRFVPEVVWPLVVRKSAATQLFSAPCSGLTQKEAKENFLTYCRRMWVVEKVFPATFRLPAACFFRLLPQGNLSGLVNSEFSYYYLPLLHNDVVPPRRDGVAAFFSLLLLIQSAYPDEKNKVCKKIEKWITGKLLSRNPKFAEAVGKAAQQQL